MTIRTMMLAGLMAATALGAAAPAFAQDNDNGGWRGRGNGGEARSQRQEQRVEQRQDRGQQWREQRGASQDQREQFRDLRADANAQARNRDFRGGAEVRVQPQIVQQQPMPQGNRDWRNNRDGVRDGNRDSNRNWQGQRADRQDVRQDRRDGRQDWRQDRRDDRQDWRQDRRNDPRYANNRGYTDQRRWNDNNYGRGYDGRNRLDNRERWSNQRRWDNGWRNDRRYDWQSYRRNYGQVYRPGRYYAPRGWNYGYRQFSVGIFLDSMLYSNNYWLDDPYRYRLPPVYGSLRWVRYYDDALLVDTRDGYVVDVINGFFY